MTIQREKNKSKATIVELSDDDDDESEPVLEVPMMKAAKSKHSKSTKQMSDGGSKNNTNTNTQTVNITLASPATTADSKTSKTDSATKTEADALEKSGEKLKVAFKDFNLAKQAAETAKIVIPKTLSHIDITEKSVDTSKKIDALIVEILSRTKKIKALTTGTTTATATGNVPKVAGSLNTALTNSRRLPGGVFPVNDFSTDYIRQPVTTVAHPQFALTASAPTLKQTQLQIPKLIPGTTTLEQQLTELETTAATTTDTSTVDESLADLETEAQLEAEPPIFDSSAAVSQAFTDQMRKYASRLKLAGQMNTAEETHDEYIAVSTDLSGYIDSLTDPTELNKANKVQEKLTAKIMEVPQGVPSSLQVFMVLGVIPEYPNPATTETLKLFRREVFYYMLTEEWSKLSPAQKNLFVIKMNMASQEINQQEPDDADVDALVHALYQPQLVKLLQTLGTSLAPSTLQHKTKRPLAELILKKAYADKHGPDLVATQ